MSRAGVRTARVSAASVVLVPLLLLNAYLLAWFLPELSDGRRPWLWIVIFALTAASLVCLASGWFRRHRSARWWLWPLAAALLVAISWPAVARL
ncbi:hypothetical protein GA0070616_2437 [Micromonospora nigra]|uniref:Uncharacterized protein n=1 Tax=Micromonospora nigra TaxID=145857 RepID=A0A1C6RY35_9ACTN|nr:hypothetical protein [Micromonospora nigra]SCL21984.1 hypothetical protein GA0070616_2437 [Micromonospora nigra]